MSSLSSGGSADIKVRDHVRRAFASDIIRLYVLNDVFSVNAVMFPGDVGPGDPQFQHSVMILLISYHAEANTVSRLTCGSLLALVCSLFAS